MKKASRKLTLSMETLATLDLRSVDGAASASNTWGCTCGCTQNTTGSNPTYNGATGCGYGGTNDWACSLASVCYDQQY